MILIKNCTALEFNPPRVQEGVDILIEGGRILGVGTGLPGAERADKVIQGEGKLVYPGLVCSHNHFYSGLSRGILASIKPSPDFVSVLQNLWWRLDRAIDKEILHYSGLICSLEAIKCGSTAVIDHHASPGYIEGSLATLRETFLQTGLRGMTCFETTDRNGGMAEVEAGVAENVAFARLIDEKKGSEPYLVEAHIGAHAPFTVPQEGMKLLAEAVSSTGRGLHIHAAEDKYDQVDSHARYRQDLTARLDDFGLLNSKALMVHGLYFSDDDVERLNRRDAFLVHNPRSNMNNNVGYNQKLGAYKNLALGTDGIGSDMFEEFKVAFFKHKDAGGPLWPDSFLRFLHNGNELLARNFNDSFGLLREGYKADLVIAAYDSPTPLVAENIAGHMAFGMGSKDVETVIIDGKVVYEDRAFPFDTKDIYRGAREAAARLWKIMDQE